MRRHATTGTAKRDALGDVATVGSVTWLPANFVPPVRVELPGWSHHLRPIGPGDTESDMAAVMGSQARLWSIFGEAWGWPPTTLTAEQDRDDLARHAAEMITNDSFNYALFDERETVLLGCASGGFRTGADLFAIMESVRVP